MIFCIKGVSSLFKALRGGKLQISQKLTMISLFFVLFAHNAELTLSTDFNEAENQHRETGLGFNSEKRWQYRLNTLTRSA